MTTTIVCNLQSTFLVWKTDKFFPFFWQHKTKERNLEQDVLSLFCQRKTQKSKQKYVAKHTRKSFCRTVNRWCGWGVCHVLKEGGKHKVSSLEFFSNILHVLSMNCFGSYIFIFASPFPIPIASWLHPLHPSFSCVRPRQRQENQNFTQTCAPFHNDKKIPKKSRAKSRTSLMMMWGLFLLYFLPFWKQKDVGCCSISSIVMHEIHFEKDRGRSLSGSISLRPWVVLSMPYHYGVLHMTKEKAKEGEEEDLVLFNEEQRDMLRRRIGLTDKDIKGLSPWKKTDMKRYINTKDVDNKISFLQQRLRLTTKKSLKKFVMNYPTVLSFKLSTMEYKINWLQGRLHLTDKQLSRIVQVLPRICLSYSIKTNLEPKFRWLQTRLNITDDELSKMMCKWPRIAGYNVNRTLDPRLNMLQERLDLTPAELGQLVVRYPRAVGITQHNMQEGMTWCEDQLGLDVNATKKLLIRQPEVLTLKRTTLETRVIWLQQHLNLVDRTDVSKIICSQPSVLTNNVDSKLQPQLDWLQAYFNLDKAGLRSMVLYFPAILVYSIGNNLQVKMEFYEKLLGEEAAHALIIKTPQYLSYSLEKRVKPRLAQVKKLDIHYSLSSLVVSTDDRWNCFVENAVEKRKNAADKQSNLMW